VTAGSSFGNGAAPSTTDRCDQRPPAASAADLFRLASRVAPRSVQIRPIEARDYDFLFRLYTTGDHLVRYRLRGITPSPESFVRFLWDQVLAQFIVETRDGRPIGVVSSFEPDFRNRYVYIAACSVADYQATGLVLEGVALLVSYLFETFDFRKIYAETLESNYAQFALGEGRLFEVEGRMKEHEYIQGRYEDFVLLAIHRASWREQHQRIFGEEGCF
jgi:RimJ/RimL family protein N-acetyltransferase